MRHVVVALILALSLAVPVGAAAADPSPAPGAWTIAELPPVAGTDANVHDVAAGPDGLVAIGARITSGSDGPLFPAAPELWTSADGITWTPVDPEGSGVVLGWYRPVLSGPEVGLIAVTHGPSGFVLVGRSAPSRSSAPRISTWRSVDGIAWDAATPEVFPPAARPGALVGTPTGYLAGGVVYGRRAPLAAVWVSADGLRWTRATAEEGFGVGGYIDTMEDPASGGIRSLAPYGDGAIATGLTCFPSFDKESIWAWSGACWGTAWRSEDGLRWSASEAPQTHGEIGQVATLGTRVVATVVVCHTCPPAILVSDDGVTWSFAYGAPVGGGLVELLATGDGFRALLLSGDGTLAVWASPDGSDWTEMAPLPPLPAGTTAVRQAAMSAFGDRLVIVVAAEGDGIRSFAIMGPAGG